MNPFCWLGHHWDGCKCKRVGCKARNHDWQYCACTRCGKKGTNHNWDVCRCKICGTGKPPDQDNWHAIPTGSDGSYEIRNVNVNVTETSVHNYRPPIHVRKLHCYYTLICEACSAVGRQPFHPEDIRHRWVLVSEVAKANTSSVGSKSRSYWRDIKCVNCGLRVDAMGPYATPFDANVEPFST